MRIEKRRRHFGMFAGVLTLSVSQVCLSEILVRIGGLRVGEQNELHDLERLFQLAHPHVVRANDADRDLREQLCLWVLASGLEQLPCDLRDAIRLAQLVDDRR